jgi:hypothetical protein
VCILRNKKGRLLAFSDWLLADCASKIKSYPKKSKNPTFNDK